MEDVAGIIGKSTMPTFHIMQNKSTSTSTLCNDSVCQRPLLGTDQF